MNDSTLQLLKKSLEWIDAHPDATNNDLPIELLELWTDEPRGQDWLPNDFHLGVFLFAFARFQNRRMLANGVTEMAFPYGELLDSFDRWQAQLWDARTHRTSGHPSLGLRMFDFPDPSRS